MSTTTVGLIKSQLCKRRSQSELFLCDGENSGQVKAAPGTALNHLNLTHYSSFRESFVWRRRHRRHFSSALHTELQHAYMRHPLRNNSKDPLSG